jgi:outer membrane receptor for ferrienterochelin and colicin
MTGFELNVNGEKISAGLERGVISIIVTKVSDEFIDSIDLDFTGLNSSEKGNEETIDWYKSKLDIGDELTIKVKDVLTNSSPLEIRKKNRESENERKLKSFHALKKELENKGLI